MASEDAAPITVGKLILDYLSLEGVTHIFGVPGGGVQGMLLELYKARGKLSYVVCRQETGAAYMADGYARASGKLGVVLVTTGPGATNALTGVVNAEAAGSPLLVLTGEIAEAYFGTGYLQEGIDSKLDVNSVFRAACAYSVLIPSPVSAQKLIEAALRTALAVPRHAAHLSLPWDISSTPVPVDSALPVEHSCYRGGPAVAPEELIARTLDMLKSAQRPLILLGNGCREALRVPTTLRAFTRFVEAAQIPVMTTADGKGVFPEDHPLSMRAFGLADSLWPFAWFEQTDPAYDMLLVVGSGLGEMATDKWSKWLKPNGGKIVQLNAEPRVLGRNYAIDLAIAGEAGDFLNRLATSPVAMDWDQPTVAARSALMAQIHAASSFADEASYLSTDGPIHPAALCRVMQEKLAGTPTIVMLDAGNCVGWGLHYLIAGPAFEVHASLDMGPMGFAVGAVIGARIAQPNTICVALTGDGAFMMQGSEISTAQHNGVGAIWVVLQDNDLAMVSQGMAMVTSKSGDPVSRDEWRTLYSLGAPDLVKFASGLGADAVSISTPSEFAAAMDAALIGAAKGRPQVIVAQIDQSAEPPYYLQH